MLCMSQLHVVHLPLQTNVYSFTILPRLHEYKAHE